MVQEEPLSCLLGPPFAGVVRRMPALGGQENWKSKAEDVGYLGWWSPLILATIGVYFLSQESTVYACHGETFKAWDTLPLLDERVTLKFIMPETYLLKYVIPLPLVTTLKNRTLSLAPQRHRTYRS